MQPTQSFSVPRRALDFEDYIDIVRRHKGWIFGPFLFTLVCSVVGVFLWPNSYESSATVQIKPQQLPENLVQAAIPQDMQERINTMANNIMSRTQLTAIIRNFDLYKKDVERLPIEDVIERMRKNISIQPVQQVSGGRTITAFTISFTYENRLDAQRVVSDLVSRFLTENVRSRKNSTFQTTEFMQDQADLAKAELDAAETKLTEFRMQNNGRLPDQLDSNMRQLTTLQNNYGYLQNAISRSEAEKAQLETSLKIAEGQVKALSVDLKVSPLIKPKSQRLVDAEHEVEGYEKILTDLRRKYTETHPDVQVTRDRLTAAQERLAKAQEQEKAEAGPSGPVVDPNIQREIRSHEANIQMLQTQIKTKDTEISEYHKQLKQASDQMNAASGRIGALPVSDQQYADLMRDVTLARDRYVQMKSKLDAANIAQDMEGREQGETLDLLDPANLPTEPTEPKRALVISVGAGLGLMLGLIIAGVREVKDTSLKNLKDVRAYTQMSILGSVPLLENDFVVRRRRRIAWLGWTAACLTAVITMAGSIVYYITTRV